MSNGADDRDKALIQRWEIARKLIEHEDNLQHQRISALLTLQAFLFTGFALIAVNIADKDRAEYRLHLMILLGVLAIVGLVSPLLFYRSLRAALRQVEAAKIWWREFLKGDVTRAADSGESDLTPEQQRGYAFPPIVGNKAKFVPWIFKDQTYTESFKGINFDYIDKETTNKKFDWYFGFSSLPIVLSVAWATLLFVLLVITVCSSQSPRPEASGDGKPAEIAEIWQPVVDRICKLLDCARAVVDHTPPASPAASIVVSPVISGPAQECCCKAEDVKEPPSRPKKPCPPSGSDGRPR